jgi:hypothetical protein
LSAMIERGYFFRLPATKRTAFASIFPGLYGSGAMSKETCRTARTVTPAF